MADRERSRVWAVLRPIVTGLALFVVLAALWEGYKVFGQHFDDRLPGLGWKLPVATDDLAMPHVRDIIAASFFDPPRRGDTEPLVVRTAALGGGHRRRGGRRPGDRVRPSGSGWPS